MSANDDRLEFYDPLYETIIFERGLPARGFRLAPPDDPLDPKEFVQTAEFSRLAFLNQVGLAWLIFPSATHTRFAHSIGCWWLGRIAETLIRVRQGTRERSLQKWLTAAGLREEFYLALLLHDIGHGPLSHVLERNATFVECLKRAGVTRWEHEFRGAELLLGDNALVEAWREAARERFGNSQTFFDMRERLSKIKSLCLPAVCYLMTGAQEYLSSCNHAHASQIAVVKELVSGLLDLDRLDHYARDSYFSGLRHVAVNVRGFLTNLRVEPHHRRAYLCLTPNGASHAAGLLFSKRQILSTMFRNPKSLALHAMVNTALTSHLEAIVDDGERVRTALRIAWMQDDEFLQMLADSKSQDAAMLARRIRAIRPFTLVGRWSRQDLPVGLHLHDVQRLLRKKEAQLGCRLVAHFDDGFWDRGRQPDSRDWLDASRLITDDTRLPLTDHPFHREDFAYLREADKARSCWLFSSEENSRTDISLAFERLIATKRHSRTTRS